MSRDRLLTLALATAGFGASTLMRKLAVDKLHPLQYQFISACFYTVLIPVFWYSNQKYGDTTQWNVTGVWWALAATFIHVVAAFFFNNVLKSGNDTGLVSALSSASPIVTLMLSFMIFNELPTPMGMIGMLFVLIGVVLMCLG